MRVIFSKKSLLILCMLLSGYCGILAELSLFNLGTVLLGGTNSTLFYTMGVMMFFMGVGSLITESSWFTRISFDHFAALELLLSFFAMISIPSIHWLAGDFPKEILFAFLIFSAMIGTLIGMEIPLILRLNQNLGLDLKENSARVMMADYFGSLLAFMMFPFVLFPNVGISWSAVSGGFVNLILALITLIAFHRFFQEKKLILASSLILLIFSFFLFFHLDSVTKLADHRLYRDPVTFQANTAYQKLVFTKKDPFLEENWTQKHKETGKVLYLSESQRFELKEFENSLEKDFRFFINGGLQFSTVDEYRYHETLVHPALFLGNYPQQILILGGGDGLAAREILKYKTVEEIILVDLDPELTHLFRHTNLAAINDFSLQNPKVRIVNEDAFIFLKNISQKWPVIIMDFPDPYDIHTAKLYSRQFFAMLKNNLDPDGILALQATSPLYNRKSFLSIKKTLESEGFFCAPAKVEMKTFELWGFHFCSLSLSGEKIKERLLGFSETVPTRYLNREAIISSLSFGKDTFHDYEKIPVNDLNRLVIPSLYRNSLLE